MAAPLLAGCMTVGAAEAHGQSVDRFPPAQRDRVLTAARMARAVLTDWFGPATPQPPNLDDVPVRWLVFERDQSLERAVIASVTRQFWSTSIGRDQLTPFETAVVDTVSRAIQQRLDVRRSGVVRFFNGTLAWPLRTLRHAEAPADPDVSHLVRRLQTVARYVGWPVMAQSLAALRAAPAPRLDVDALAGALSAIRGTDLQHLVRECFRPDVVFDYAIGEVRASDGAMPIETFVRIDRTGAGMFEAGTGADRERTMPLLIRFADGSELRDWFDGAAERTTLVYSAPSRVVMAAIDPEHMLLLDQDRTNNAVTTTTAIRPLGVQLSLHWMSWLQQMMLTYSALV